jgi:spore coat polysaccharide biosynthesis predicted glycosyltransferase SpsG
MEKYNADNYKVSSEDFKKASPEMQKFIKFIDESIDKIENSVDSPVKKLYYVTRLLEAVEEEKKKRGLV